MLAWLVVARQPSAEPSDRRPRDSVGTLLSFARGCRGQRGLVAVAVTTAWDGCCCRPAAVRDSVGTLLLFGAGGVGGSAGFRGHGVANGGSTLADAPTQSLKRTEGPHRG